MTAKAKLVMAALALTALGACTAQFDTHGYIPPEDELQQIVPGIDTRATVEDLIGVPTTSGVQNDSGFYYIETDMRRYGWKRAEVTDRQIVAVTFDSVGVVDNIVTYGLQDGRVVPLTRRITRSGDGDISFIRKLFGNIGGLTASSLLGDG